MNEWNIFHVCEEQKIYKLSILFLYWEVQSAAKSRNAIDKKLQLILGLKFEISWETDEAIGRELQTDDVLKAKSRKCGQH